MFVEYAVKSLNKHGEELCGDSALVSTKSSSMIALLSDGLGSGVKANILATLTNNVIKTMLEGGASIDEVVETLGRTLPVCRVRKLAYSTFTIVQVDEQGRVYLAEFDNPATKVFRNNEPLSINRRSRIIGNVEVKEAAWQGQEGDVFIAFSDGVLHAGIGAKLDFGWLPQKVEKYINSLLRQGFSVGDICEKIVNQARKLSDGHPRDDTTVVGLQLRQKRTITVAAGPPRNRQDDVHFAQELLTEPKVKVVCGGTTATIVARELNKKLEVNLPRLGELEVPPTGNIEGLDLVTEGILTLSTTLRLLKEQSLPPPDNGATRLASLLLQGDEIRFLVGRAVNPAHQNPRLPVALSLKQHVIEQLSQLLRSLGKRVVVNYY